MNKRIYLPYNRSPKAREQTFRAAQPLATHYGWVSCQDYECAQFLVGFKLVLPIDSDLTAWIRNIRDKVIQVAVDQRGRPVTHRYNFTETITSAALVEFVFPPGQPCFNASKHLWHIRPPIFAHDKNEMRRTLKFDDFTDLMNEETFKNERRMKGG